MFARCRPRRLPHEQDSIRQRLHGDELPEELAGALLRAVASIQAGAAHYNNPVLLSLRKNPMSCTRNMAVGVYRT